ncbi:DUF2075 domain-containing protein [Ilyobacter sp.]|uniref:DUF2075 domain-containing protein n=1 Tax=Ilyobacter sp. TaxID=3100343 RepID=UPI00356557E9
MPFKGGIYIKRAYYSNSINNFLIDDNNLILGELSKQHSYSLEELQKNAWIEQIKILKKSLENISEGHIFFEFSIPRMGKRVDNIIIYKDSILVFEFKVGSKKFDNYAVEQVTDYALDLKNFHEGSHYSKIFPILVSTESEKKYEDISIYHENLFKPLLINSDYIESLFTKISSVCSEKDIDPKQWERSIYKPTPTIIEAAQALYKGHNVKEISRSDAGAINLSKTANCLNNIIEYSKENSKKSICFITGVPGAGKTLAGLNIATERMKADEGEHAVFLSGNGPLVEVLREALTRDKVLSEKSKGIKITKKEASIKSNAFIQNIHHFRDEYIISSTSPIEKVVVFDEAQRAWNLEQASSFMKRKKGLADFNMSEPEFLIDVMNRHNDWCTIVCLIGGGQEINTGEAGLEEWIRALQNKYLDWDVYYSNLIETDANYLNDENLRNWLKKNSNKKTDLHLAVSLRSFRSEKLAEFIENIIDLNLDNAKLLYKQLKENYPIVITRSLESGKEFIRNSSKGSERFGLIASSGARRLRAHGIDVKNEISASNWFLNNKSDIRSSYFMEEIAIEFDIQGLELDWTCMCWGADFYLEKNRWKYRSFKGTKWQNMNSEIGKKYLKNAYRVLLTRARQGMVIFIPEGSGVDETRDRKFYDHTYEYFKSIGVTEV